MPFFDDSGPRLEEQRGPLERSFALLRDQLERMVGLNILWALQALPILIAWAFPLPDLVRAVLTLYSALAIPPATAVMFAVIAQVDDGEPINQHLLMDCIRTHLRAGLLKLMPLYSLFFWLGLLVSTAAERGWMLIDVLGRLSILLLVTVSLYWGPLIAVHPDRSIVRMASDAIRLFWRHPGHTLLLGACCAVALLLGVISIAGVVLIIPILIMLMQMEFYFAIARTSPELS